LFKYAKHSATLEVPRPEGLPRGLAKSYEVSGPQAALSSANLFSSSLVGRVKAFTQGLAAAVKGALSGGAWGVFVEAR